MQKKISLKQEKELVEKAKKDWKAFEEIYKLYVQEIYHYLIGRVGSRELAEDITSETFLKAMENIKKFKWHGIPFKAWLYRIAINCANQVYKKNKRESSVNTEILDIIADKTNHITKEIDRSREKKRLMKAIQKLPKKERELVILKYFQEMSYNEISTITGISSNLVGVRLHRAIKRLHVYL